MSQITSIVGGEGLGEGSVIRVEQPAAKETQELVVDEERLREATEFVPVEEQPIPAEMPKPIYREIARRAGIEGKVPVHILVDRMGKVRAGKIHPGGGDLSWSREGGGLEEHLEAGHPEPQAGSRLGGHSPEVYLERLRGTSMYFCTRSTIVSAV